MNIVALADMLVVTDFDGTLAPIGLDPQAVRPVPGAVDALNALTEKTRSVVLLTGRSRPSLEEVFPTDEIARLRVLCDYGAEGSEIDLRALERFRDQLKFALLPEGVRVEEKAYSLALHTRQTDNPQRNLHMTMTALAPVARDLGLTMHQGRDVIDFSVAQVTKASTVQRLIAEVEPLGVMIFGDDHSDVDAFRSLTIPHLTVGVSSNEVSDIEYISDVVVSSPDEVVSFMQEICTFTHVELSAPLFE